MTKNEKKLSKPNHDKCTRQTGPVFAQAGKMHEIKPDKMHEQHRLSWVERINPTLHEAQRVKHNECYTTL